MVCSHSYVTAVSGHVRWRVFMPDDGKWDFTKCHVRRRRAGTEFGWATITQLPHVTICAPCPLNMGLERDAHAASSNLLWAWLTAPSRSDAYFRWGQPHTVLLFTHFCRDDLNTVAQRQGCALRHDPATVILRRSCPLWAHGHAKNRFRCATAVCGRHCHGLRDVEIFWQAGCVLR